MRILHITNMMEQGGVDSLLLELLPQLNSDTNQEVELLVLDRKNCGLVAQIEKRGVKCHISKYSGAYDPRNIFQIRKYSKGFDIVHIHLFPSQLYGVLAMTGLRNRPKLVTTEHCTTNNRRKRGWLRVVDHWMYGHYAKIVGVGQAATDNVTEWARVKDGIAQTILNGINLSRFANIERQERSYLDVPSTCIAVVMVARFFNQKDQKTAIRSMNYTISNIHLVFVGSGDTMAECQALANELDVAQRVHFLGCRDDIPLILTAADICLLSTHYEGIPISIIEYFASGKPVIATNVEGVNEMIDQPYLLCAENDSQSLALAINTLASDPKLMAEIGKYNSRKSYKYTFDGMVARYKHLYKTICNKI